MKPVLARLARGEDRETPNSSQDPAGRMPSSITASSPEHSSTTWPGRPRLPRYPGHTTSAGAERHRLYTDTALLETHVLAYHRVSAESEHRDIVIGGRYLDWMDKIDNEWRISRRTMVYDWVEDLGESVNWTTGLMGMPFDANRYAGRAAGDYSEKFFDDRWTSVTEDTTE